MLPTRESERFGTAFNELTADIKEEKLVELYGDMGDYFHITERLAWLILKDLITKHVNQSDEILEFILL